MDIQVLLKLARVRSASDVHLVVGSAPSFRVNGLLVSSPDLPSLYPEDIETAFTQITTPEQRASFKSRLELDFACTLPEIGRFRCNAFRQRGTTSLAIRLLPLLIPTVDELELPQVCKELVTRRRGLVIISGATGSGKSTTLAAMIQHLNSTESRRIVTVEDPIEFVFTSNKCIITQRDLGNDTLTFAEALRHVLRQDPDVILVGEVRDAETASAVLSLAETGHLILTTGHAPSAAKTVERIIDLFPPYERYLAQARLASELIGILCQCLVPRADGAGRVVAVEVMRGNPAVRNLIREGKIHQIPNVIRTSGQLGMELLDQSLVRLYFRRLIARETLFAFCNDRDEVARLIGEMACNREPMATS
jgi:twitching motility protein PilT